MSARQREYRELATELGVVRERLVGTHCAYPFGLALEAGRKADPGPATNAREHAHILLAAVQPRVDVADDSRRGFEAIELAARLGINSLQVALQRSVENDIARGRKSTGPDRE